MRDDRTRSTDRPTDPNLGLLPSLPPVDQDQRQWMLNEWKQTKDFGKGVANVVSLQNGKYPNILVFGGIDPLKPKEYFIGTTIFLYELHEERWSYFGPLPEPRSYHAATFVSGNIYITGGFDPLNIVDGEAVCTSTTFQLNIKTKRWNLKHQMHDCRACHGTLAKEGTIFVFGGKDGPGTILDSVEYFDIKTDRWTVLNNMPKPIMGMAVTTLDNLIYIMGGVTGRNDKDGTISDETFLYDYKQNRWSNAKCLPLPLAYCSAVTMRREIWIFGGMTSTSSSDAVYSLSSKSSDWEHRNKLSTAKHSMACAKIGKQVFLIGGISSVNKGAINEMDIFDHDTCEVRESATIPCQMTGAAAVAVLPGKVVRTSNTNYRSEEEVYSASVSIQRAFRKFRDEKTNIETRTRSKAVQVSNKDMEAMSPTVSEKRYSAKTTDGSLKRKQFKTGASVTITWPPSPNPSQSSSEVYHELGNECPIHKLCGEYNKLNYMKITPFLDPNLGMVPTLDNLLKKTRRVLGLKKLELRPSYLDTMKTTQTLQHTEVPAIVLLGGFNPKDPINLTYGKTVLRYSVGKDKWEFCGMMPESRNQHAAAVLFNTIYVTGGYDPDLRHHGEMVATKTCLAMEINSKKWNHMAEMTKARAHHGMVALNDKLYVVGGRGCDGRALDSLEEYNPKSNTWKQLEPMNVPRMGMAVAGLDNHIWIMGGLSFEDDSCYFRENKRPPVASDVICYDVQSCRWNKMPSLTTERAFCSAVAVDGRVIVCGGCGGSVKAKDCLVSVDSIELYKPDAGEWERKERLISPRHCAATVAVERCIYSFGGINSHDWAPLHKNEVYFLEDDTVTLMRCLPVPIAGAAAVTLPATEPRYDVSSFTRIVRNRLETSV